MLKNLKKLEGKEITLLEMDNTILNIIEGGESIFNYSRNYWENGSFSYLDKYNVYFNIVEDNTDSLDIIVKITDVEII